MLHQSALTTAVEKQDWRRIGGSLAALCVLAGAPSASFVIESLGLYDLTIPLALLLLSGLGLLAGRLLWPDQGYSGIARTLLGAGFFAAVTAIAAFTTTYAIQIAQSLCGPDGNGQPTSATVAMFGSYLLIGLWGFQHPRRLVWAWPLAVATAFALALGVTAALPSGHGYCET